MRRRWCRELPCWASGSCPGPLTRYPLRPPLPKHPTILSCPCMCHGKAVLAVAPMERITLFTVTVMFQLLLSSLCLAMLPSMKNDYVRGGRTLLRPDLPPPPCPAPAPCQQVGHLGSTTQPQAPSPLPPPPGLHPPPCHSLPATSVRCIEDA